MFKESTCQTSPPKFQIAVQTSPTNTYRAKTKSESPKKPQHAVASTSPMKLPESLKKQSPAKTPTKAPIAKLPRKSALKDSLQKKVPSPARRSSPEIPSQMSFKTQKADDGGLRMSSNNTSVMLSVAILHAKHPIF